MWFATWKKWYLTQKLASADTTLRIDRDIWVSEGRLKLKDPNNRDTTYVEWLSFATNTANGDGTYTLGTLVRWLSQTADPATAGTWKTFWAGTECVLVAMHDQLLDRVQWVQATVFADPAARDVAIPVPSNWRIIYVTSLGILQQYVGWTWTDFASGTTLNATTTAAGKLEVAVASDINSQTVLWDSWAPLAITPNWLASVDSYCIWENVSSTNALTLEKYYPVAYCDSQVSFWNATATQWLAFRMVGNWNFMTTLNVGLKKVGTPADNVSIEIQSNSAGAPSGTVLWTWTISWGSLTTSSVDTTVSGYSFVPTDLTVYWVVFKRSWAIDAVNYYQVTVHTDDTVAFPYKINNAWVWGSNLLTESPSLYSNWFYAQYAVKAFASNQKFCSVQLFATTTLTFPALVWKNQARVYTWFSNLREYRPYYLSNTAWAISLTPGTIPTYVGTAKSSITMWIPLQWFYKPRVTTSVAGATNTSTLFTTWKYTENGGYVMGGTNWTFTSLVTIQTSQDNASWTSIRTAWPWPDSLSNYAEHTTSAYILPWQYYRMGYIVWAIGSPANFYLDFYENNFI